MKRVYRSKAIRTMEGTDSIRATVSEGIAVHLKIEPGDTIIWTIENDGRVTVTREASKKNGRGEK